MDFLFCRICFILSHEKEILVSKNPRILFKSTKSIDTIEKAASVWEYMVLNYKGAYLKALGVNYPL